MNKGRIIAAQGPIVDVAFPEAKDLPGLYEIVKAKTFDQRIVLLKVTEHLEDIVARCIALSSTLNLQRNSEVEATGSLLKVPVGQSLFGRIINVIGEPIDNKGKLNTEEFSLVEKDRTSVGSSLLR